MTCRSTPIFQLPAFRTSSKLPRMETLTCAAANAMKHLIQAMTIFWAVCASTTAKAEMATGLGEQFYGPEMSENAACDLAEKKAKAAALASVLGETVSNEEQLFCKQSTGKATDGGCEFNRVTWSLIEGDITAIKNLKRSTEKRLGTNACVVSLEAEIVIPTKKPDPNFEVKVTTNQMVYRVGDDFSLAVESTEPAHLAIFNWLPNENDQVHRIIPQDAGGGADMGILKKNASGKLRVDFGLMATWSNAYKDTKKQYDEWLIVIASKRPYKWLPTYDLDQFKEKLREIPVDERRIVRRGYLLSR